MSRRRSGLVVPMPELDAIVGAIRHEWDPVAPLGVHAHVTVLFPFAPPSAIDDALVDRVDRVVTTRAPHPVTFSILTEFPGPVLYLAPEPAEPFRALTRALAAAFPEFPPYEGQFPDIVPHLTVAHGAHAPRAAIEAELAPRLPLTTTAERVELWVEGEDDRWRTRARFPLRGEPGPVEVSAART
jgi:2'-5' RNA ligase